MRSTLLLLLALATAGCTNEAVCHALSKRQQLTQPQPAGTPATDTCPEYLHERELNSGIRSKDMQQ